MSAWWLSGLISHSTTSPPSRPALLFLLIIYVKQMPLRFHTVLRLQVSNLLQGAPGEVLNLSGLLRMKISLQSSYTFFLMITFCICMYMYVKEIVRLSSLIHFSSTITKHWKLKNIFLNKFHKHQQFIHPITNQILINEWYQKGHEPQMPQIKLKQTSINYT